MAGPETEEKGAKRYLKSVVKMSFIWWITWNLHSYISENLNEVQVGETQIYIPLYIVFKMFKDQEKNENKRSKMTCDI